MQWFIDHRPDLDGGSRIYDCKAVMEQRRLLSVVTATAGAYPSELFDESEFLSPFGIRSLSRYHKDHPYMLTLDGAHFGVGYEPGESEIGHLRRQFQLARTRLVSR